MNDIQMKENAYTAACASVERHTATLEAAICKTQTAEKAYVQTVAQAALASEKLRRKKDSMVSLAKVAIIAVVFLVLAFVQPYVALGFLAISIIGTLISRSNNKVARDLNLSNRKSFFDKYGYAASESATLKWKGLATSSGDGSLVNRNDEWTCTKCGKCNNADSSYCVHCGAAKSTAAAHTYTRHE